MASGVKVADDVKLKVQEMTVVRNCADQANRARLMVLEIKDGEVKEKETLRESDLAGCSAFDKLRERSNECCYMLYDCHYETNECKKEDMVFLMCTPDNATIKDKMRYAASKKCLSNLCEGIKYDISVHDPGEIADPDCLSHKMGQKMLKLEGHDCPSSYKK